MIKSYLRSTMSDDRLSALSILLKETTFKNLILKIADFASAKTRKIHF